MRSSSYNASFAPDGKSVVFTSERHGPGQSDVFRARLDGTGIEPLVTSPAVDDAAAMSPDGRHLAFVSTATATARTSGCSTSSAARRAI